MIHPTAIIHPKARLDASVRVGPFAVIDEGVELGADCVVGPHVYLTGQTQIGAKNTFHAGCVIGDAPQDLKYKNEPTRVRIGEGNIFREYATVHRPTKADAETVIGSNNFLMANAHVAHNCVVGDHVIMANGAMLGGHAVVQDRAFISGNCLVHQFCRVGTLAMMQGGSAISIDLPPFCVGLRVNEMCGLNVVGLRRANISAEERMELKKLYRFMFRDRRALRDARAGASKEFCSAPAKILLEFLANAKRGVCADIARSKSENE
ncbi:MAG TPA: acyl-ACP--UDP-N-acetylglucosamine O-acyltransferase [Verrucomicrobiae bacterium]|jgi:UDP-N-acetylglucosamine acyltransferase